MEALNAIPASAYFFWSGLSKPKSAVGDWQRSLKRLLILAGVPDGHAHRFHDTFSVELLLAGVPIERVSILLGHQSVRITEKHYAPWVRARQEQLEADVRRTWHAHEPQQGVHAGYTENDARVIPFKSRRKNGGGGGSRNANARWGTKFLSGHPHFFSSLPPLPIGNSIGSVGGLSAISSSCGKCRRSGSGTFTFDPFRMLMSCRALTTALP